MNEDEGMWRNWLESNSVQTLSSFLCLDFPKGSNFGIDMNFWVTGEHFQGIKMIPPGFHYIRFKIADQSLTGQEETIVPTTLGIFAFLSQGQVMVRRWSPQNEELDLLDEDDAKRFELGVGNMDFDTKLGAYPISSLEKWKNLTNFITKNTIKKRSPTYNLLINSKNYPPLIDRKPSVDDYNFRFISIPKKWVPKGDLSPSEITLHSLDKSSLLSHILETYYSNEDELIGDFQFAFITFWLAEEFDGFEFWKSFIIMMCSCDSALSTRQHLFVNFLTAFYYQLMYIPQDFFYDPLSSSNFLIPSFQSLFELISSCDVQLIRLEEIFIKFKTLVEERFERKFDVSEYDDVEVVDFE